MWPTLNSCDLLHILGMAIVIQYNEFDAAFANYFGLLLAINLRKIHGAT